MNTILLTRKDAMVLLGVGENTFKNMRLAGIVKGYRFSKVPSARMYYRREDIEKIRGLR